MLRYYVLVGDLMMAHLEGRPASLVRSPTGIGGKLFFQKHLDNAALSGISPIEAELRAGPTALLQVMNKQGLLSAAKWKMIEIHTFNATQLSLKKPDRMVFTLMVDLTALLAKSLERREAPAAKVASAKKPAAKAALNPTAKFAVKRAAKIAA